MHRSRAAQDRSEGPRTSTSTVWYLQITTAHFEYGGPLMEGSPLFSGWKAKGPARWRGLRRAIGLLCLPAHRKEGASCSLRPLVSSVSVVPDQAPPGSTSHGRGVAAGLSVMITRETATVQPGAGHPSPTRSLGLFCAGDSDRRPGPGYVHGASALQVPCQSQAGRWRGRIMSTQFRKKKLNRGPPPGGRPRPNRAGASATCAVRWRPMG